MSRAISRRLPPVSLGILTVGALMAALLSAPAVVPAHATTADRTVTLTLKCSNDSCSGSWYWYQGGITGTLLGSGSIAGPADSTTKGTTTQPAAADTLTFGVKVTSNCGRGFTEYITPGSAINFTASVQSTNSYFVQCNGSYSFTMKS